MGFCPVKSKENEFLGSINENIFTKYWNLLDTSPKWTLLFVFCKQPCWNIYDAPVSKVMRELIVNLSLRSSRWEDINSHLKSESSNQARMGGSFMNLHDKFMQFVDKFDKYVRQVPTTIHQSYGIYSAASLLNVWFWRKRNH